MLGIVRISMGVLVMLALCLLAACGEQDNVGAGVVCNKTYSLTEDVMPVITSNCALTGCHNGTHAPNLRTAEAVRTQVERVRAEVTSGHMPPKGSGVILTAEERKTILCWIEQGAADN